jgi:holin-like protein
VGWHSVCPLTESGVEAHPHVAVGALQLPVPGNFVDRLIVFVLLTPGMIRLQWVEAGASLLVRHLAFFCLPIVVGLTAFGDLFVSHGVATVVTLTVSAAVGIWAAGLSSQVLTCRRGRPPHEVAPVCWLRRQHGGKKTFRNAYCV